MTSPSNALRQHLADDPAAEGVRQWLQPSVTREPLTDVQRAHLERRSKLVPWVVAGYSVAVAIGALWAFLGAVDALSATLASLAIALSLALPAWLLLRYCLGMRRDLRAGELVHYRGPLFMRREPGPGLSSYQRPLLVGGPKLRRAGWGLNDAIEGGQAVPPRALVVYGEHARTVLLLEQEDGLVRFDATVSYWAGRQRWKDAAARARAQSE